MSSVNRFASRTQIKLKEKKIIKEIPLSNHFLFSHEPISQRIPMQMFVREEELENFQVRIRYSTGGAFLITGLRGVGKTSFVNHALEQIEFLDAAPGERSKRTHVLPIFINLSRRMSATEVMHHVVRQVYSELDRKGIYRYFSKKFRRLLHVSHQRTAFAVSYSQSKTIGQEGTLSPASILNIGWTGSKNTTDGEAMEYLGYDDKAAEYDIIRILRDLSGGYRRRWRRSLSVRPIIVFDEIDKLDLAHEDDRQYLLELVSTLKAVLTTSGSIFVFVGGREMYRVWLEETREPDSIFESIFAYDLYLPCLWDLSGDILSHFLDTKAFRTSQPDIEKIERYLSYIGRGVARRIIRELNFLIRWHDRKLQIALDNKAWERIRFFSDLEDLIRSELIPQVAGATTWAQYDEMRQSIYYITDYILATDGLVFTVEDIATHFSQQEYYKRHQSITALVRVTISSLLEAHYLEKFVPKTIVPDMAVSTGYQLHQRIRDRLRSIQQWSNETAKPQEQMPFDGQIAGYQLTQLIGQGGLADVFEATQPQSLETVAIKILRRSTQNEWNTVAEKIFAREGKILEAALHPNIVKLIDKGFIDQTPYLVLERLKGVDFRQLINQYPNGLSSDLAITLIKMACEPIAALHKEGYYRLDLKPENLFFDATTERVVLIDIGTALDSKITDNDPLRQAVGTKGYMAPEVEDASSIIPVSFQSDIYAVAIIFYVLLCGKQVLHTITRVDKMTLDAKIDTSLRKILIKAASFKPHDRYSSIEEFVNALPSTSQNTVSDIAPDISIFSNVSNYDYDMNAGTDMGERSSQSSEIAAMPTPYSQRSLSTDLLLGSQIAYAPMPQTPPDPNLFYVHIYPSTTLGNGLVFPKDQNLTIGRARNNGIALNYDEISRYVGQIYRTSGQMMLEVFRDTSPVFLNGNQVKDKSVLKSRDQIRVGPVTLLIEWSD